MTSPKSNPMTCPPPIAGAGAFPVRTSAPPGGVPESERQGRVFSTKSSGLLAWYNPDSSSWKTFQRSFTEEWETYSESFPRSGTMRNGRLYQRHRWGPHIVGNGSGLWPTPTASDAMLGAFKFKSVLIRHRNLNNRAVCFPRLVCPLILSQLTGSEIAETYESLMGFPVGWTQLPESKDLETPSSRKL